MRVTLVRLGGSGLVVDVGGAALAVDPPTPAGLPTVITWTEAERVGGAAPPLAAAPAVLAWLAVDGVALTGPIAFGGFQITPVPFAPIPYAVPAEALRKTRSALRDPRLAARRLRHTLGRPRTPPLALRLERDGVVVALAQQALHRFADPAALAPLAGADVLVFGPDYEDEAAAGALAGRLGARHVVVADLIGPIRRRLGLPVRPLAATLAHAPPGTSVLDGALTLR